MTAVLAARAPRVAAEPTLASATLPRPGPAGTPGEPGPRSPDAEPPAATVLPGDESGRIDAAFDAESDDAAARRALRTVLWVPRLVVNVALSPLRLAAWANDRYHLRELYDRVFFNDAQTIGLVPSASFDTGFGVTAGARFVDRDLLGDHEHLSIEASAGGRYQQAYRATLHTGDRLGKRLTIEIAGQYELRPKDAFYGIGDHDDSARPAAPVDPRLDPTAVEVRYRERIARGAGTADLRIVDRFHLRGSAELTDRTFAASATGTPIDAIYDPMALVGYGGVRACYGELELRFDSRGRVAVYEPQPFYATGSLAAAFAGRVHRLGDGPDYWRYGIDVQHFVRLGDGPRVLALRLRGEGVSGRLSEVPFTELPQLGGADDLRGYPTDRFRDRGRLLGSVEYEWDLSAQVSAGVFVDAGRVFPSLGDVLARRARVGYGVALQAHSDSAFGVEASLASSADGGVFLSLSFNSIFALDERVRRR